MAEVPPPQDGCGRWLILSGITLRGRTTDDAPAVALRRWPVPRRKNAVEAAFTSGDPLLSQKL